MKPHIESITFHGYEALRLNGPRGAQAVVSRFGGQVLSWTPSDGRERLYLSERAIFDGREPIRGGIPVCFPQFSSQGGLPKHGFVRCKPWEVTAQRCGDDYALVTLLTEDDAATHALWSHSFELELTVMLEADTLDLELGLSNTGEEALTFTGALHTYLQVDAIENVRLSGLCGTNYRDSANGGREGREAAEILTFAGETDRIFLGASRPLSLNDGAGQLGIAQDGFTDVVVWNPWADKGAALADLPPDGWRRMLCVEAAVAGAPLTVRPGEEWYGRQKLMAD
ncbi:MAG: D-hexose-6-phosphate mutarotase [Propionivibrio sp.]